MWLYATGPVNYCVHLSTMLYLVQVSTDSVTIICNCLCMYLQYVLSNQHQYMTPVYGALSVCEISHLLSSSFTHTHSHPHSLTLHSFIPAQWLSVPLHF